MSNNIRPIALYLPQFHPIPENDKWWGKGFTEWSNVTKAKPLFKNHYQPHLPADLGFYDLRLEEARLAQEALAKQFGIYGFCYYHYWFNGTRLLYEPLDRKLKNKKEDLPFMLCWANENWTRVWDGGDKEILIEQNYSVSNDVDHIQYLLKTFDDDRYIKVNGKPFFIIYKPDKLPDVKITIETWRNEAKKVGIELYLGCMLFDDSNIPDFKEMGFDVGIQFEPFFTRCEKVDLENIFAKFVRKFIQRKASVYWEHQLFDYNDLIEKSRKAKPSDLQIYPGIVPSWDNTARRKSGATIFINSSPTNYRKWLKIILERFRPFSQEENFIFINAWNEWAEGNHLEPCSKYGKQYLIATKEICESV